MPKGCPCQGVGFRVFGSRSEAGEAYDASPLVVDLEKQQGGRAGDWLCRSGAAAPEGCPCQGVVVGSRSEAGEACDVGQRLDVDLASQLEAERGGGPDSGAAREGSSSQGGVSSWGGQCERNAADGLSSPRVSSFFRYVELCLRRADVDSRRLDVHGTVNACSRQADAAAAGRAITHWIAI